jgi:hypothetical protein
MEILHTYYDGSRLFKMSARALCQIPIWKGNRIIDPFHVENIKKSIKNNITMLDSGFKIIQYQEEDENFKMIRKSYLIDGQHRLSIISEYFQNLPDSSDFIVTVTEIRVDSESDAISYFNKINNVKPIQFQEDMNMIINRYLDKLITSFPINMKLMRTGITRRPYLSLDKFRIILQKHIEHLKLIPIETFVEFCKNINEEILIELKKRSENKNEKEIKIIIKTIELDFGLAWDDKFTWINKLIKK